MRAVCVQVGLILLATIPAARANELAARIPEEGNRPRFMVTFGPVEPPPAFVRFCTEMPEECAPRAASKHLQISAKELEQLDEVNRRINRAIAPETDIEHYGVEDYWTLPKDSRGDCEDYALLKRHILIAMGWPSSALLMTVVRAENDEGHAVLTARTSAGDLILDNRSDELKYWYQTEYKFKMRQSMQNPRVWLDLDPRDDTLPAPVAELEFLFGFKGPVADPQK